MPTSWVPNSQSISTGNTQTQWVSIPPSGFTGIATPAGPAAGDLSGLFPDPTVARINSNLLGSTNPTAGNILIADGVEWNSIPPSGVLIITPSGSTWLSPTGVTPGIYGSSDHIPILTIGVDGRVDNITSVLVSGDPPSGPAGGDLSGTYPNPTVSKVSGVPFDTNSISGNILVANGSSFNSVHPSGDIKIDPSGVIYSTKYSAIVCHGDSLSSGSISYGSAQGGYPSFLSILLNAVVFPLGVPGETSTQIAVRQGGVTTTCTIVGGQIPASGKVQVTFPFGFEPLGDTIINLHCTIAGIQGLIYNDGGGNFFFTRDVPGAAVSVAGATPFIVNTQHNENDLQILWLGRNNYHDPTTVLSDIAACIAHLPKTTPFIVLSVINSSAEPIGNSNYNIIIALNNALQTAYPNNYIDIRAFLVSQYNPSIPQDVIDFGNDVIPTSLRSDILHLNDSGYSLVAQRIADFINTSLNLSPIIPAVYTLVNNGLGGGTNTFFGYQAGQLNQIGPVGPARGTGNTEIGYLAGTKLTIAQETTSVGYLAGSAMIAADFSTNIGAQAGEKLASGIHNTNVGFGAGLSNVNGVGNTSVGSEAGWINLGSDNTFVGFATALSNIIGEQNTFIGRSAGQNALGSANVFIGYLAGASETGNNKLYIANSPTSTPLIYGDFFTPKVIINGDLTVTGVLIASVGGDLGGSLPNPSVEKIHGNLLGVTTPTAGNILVADGSKWNSVSLSGDATITPSGSIIVTGINGLPASGAYALINGANQPFTGNLNVHTPDISGVIKITDNQSNYTRLVRVSGLNQANLYNEVALATVPAGLDVSYTGAPTITFDGLYTVAKFTSNGSITVNSGSDLTTTIDSLVVGGGGGGCSAGGGAGGLIYTTGESVTQTTYSITVGDGGAGTVCQNGGVNGVNGSDSIFRSHTAIGGGGGSCTNNAAGGNSGGSGGGGGQTGTSSPGGAGTAGQGNAGGNVNVNAPEFPGAGGGGAGAVGQDAPSGSIAGNGGDGLAISITGSSLFYAGGGGGATDTGVGTNGSGGNGGGGNGSFLGGINGTANTGGGGGAVQAVYTGGNGGSGVVILRFLTFVPSGTNIKEVNLVQSINSPIMSEAGIQTYGDSSGRTVIEGMSTRFHVAGTEVGILDSTGLTIDTSVVVSGVLSANRYPSKIVSTSGSYAVQLLDMYLYADATLGPQTFNLPAASGLGRVLTVKKIDGSANTVTIQANGSDTIDGSTSQIISGQYTSIFMQDYVTSKWAIN